MKQTTPVREGARLALDEALRDLGHEATSLSEENQGEFDEKDLDAVFERIFFFKKCVAHYRRTRVKKEPKS